MPIPISGTATGGDKPQTGTSPERPSAATCPGVSRFGDARVSAAAAGRCPKGHPQRPDRPCGVCRRAETLATVISADPSLSAAQVTAAFNTAPTTAAGVRTLAAALAENPDVLHVGAPPVLGRLVTELVAAGSTTFTLPACSECAVSAGR